MNETRINLKYVLPAVNHSDSSIYCCPANIAIQHWVGILSQRRFWSYLGNRVTCGFAALKVEIVAAGLLNVLTNKQRRCHLQSCTLKSLTLRLRRFMSHRSEPDWHFQEKPIPL